MRHFLLLSFAVALVGCSSPKTSPAAEHGHHNADQHDGHDTGHELATLMVQTEPAGPSTTQEVALKLMIHQADGAMVREFDIVHEKLVHLIIVRDGLDEFAHVHPAVDDEGNLTITHTFPKAGKYRLFTDYKPKDKMAAIARGLVEVSGEPSPPPVLVVNAPGKVAADSLVAQIEMLNDKLGRASEVRFRLADEAGQPIDDLLQPYLAARGHLVVISEDGTQYVHAHPMDAATAANEVVFMCHFPAAGMYKGWAQFQVAGQVRTVPFVVQIP